MSGKISSQKRYFFPVAISALVIVLFGFWFTYWHPLLSGKPFPVLIHFHAALWFGWLILFIVQTGLIKTENRSIHQRVGIGGVLYTLVLIVVSLYIALQTVARDIHLISNSTESVPTIIPLTQILMFSVFFGLGTINRHHRELHRRFLVLAVLVAVTPALARISIGILGVPHVPLIFTVSNLLILVVIYIDWRATRRIHPVYLWGGIAILFIRIIRVPLAMSPAWKFLARNIEVLTSY